MLSRRTIVQTSLAAGTVAGLAGMAMYANWRLAQEPVADGWWPIAWPFPRDGWPPGRAWRGHDLEVYVRPKLGFCGNCDTGVVSDEEVDRVIDLLDETSRRSRRAAACASPTWSAARGSTVSR